MIQIAFYILIGLVAGLLAGLILATYRYPVWEVRKMIRYTGRQGTGMGEWNHVEKFADHNDRIIVKPSHDILYSYTFFDLRKGPYLLTMPRFDLYFSFAFLDINTNVLGYYTNRDIPEGEGAEIIIAKEPYQPTRPELPVIKLNAGICWLIGRFGVTDPSNPEPTNNVQRKITLTRHSE